ncbi:MAG: hypothetical protein ACF8CQ_12045, partial [Rhodopirellula sp. JB044]|uniref:hypothetical protein n=1 Tax=Rhodopirellula sp. JB044 TaxID=3342844 RepID=UPI00370A70D3
MRKLRRLPSGLAPAEPQLTATQYRSLNTISVGLAPAESASHGVASAGASPARRAAVIGSGNSYHLQPPPGRARRKVNA